MDGLRIALAGGGTGGHVVPGLHLLAHLRGSGRVGHVLWIGAGRRAERRALERLAELAWPAPVERLELALEPEGGGAPSLAGLLARAGPAIARARAALRRSRTDVVLGLGGYTALPAVLAASSLGIPCALLEVNAHAGRATRWLERFAALVLHAWPDSLPADARRARHVCVGPPLAPEFLRGPASDAEQAGARVALALPVDRPLLVVLGGSQGAGALNAFVRREARFLVEHRLAILHQTGPGREAEVAAGAASLPGYRAVPFVDRVDLALAAATLILARGGASTVAEIGAARRPAIIVPYPHHADQHQTRNARQLGAGALVIAESELGPAVAREIAALAGPDGVLARAAMARALDGAVPADAALRAADELEALAASRHSRREALAIH
jgi:UDP-N-acetylglucosamine--N-acetylmuramyl-(pentapeptide) pyrophosphoryl-undecaprenol N-acetylglucosamine transferase